MKIKENQGNQGNHMKIEEIQEIIWKSRKIKEIQENPVKSIKSYENQTKSQIDIVMFLWHTESIYQQSCAPCQESAVAVFDWNMDSRRKWSSLSKRVEALMPKVVDAIKRGKLNYCFAIHYFLMFHIMKNRWKSRKIQENPGKSIKSYEN